MTYYLAFLDVSTKDSGSPSLSISIMLLSRCLVSSRGRSCVKMFRSVEGMMAVSYVVPSGHHLSESKKLSFQIPLSSAPTHLLTDY